MSPRSYRVPSSGRALLLSIVLGAAFALTLFVLIALAQMMGAVHAPEKGFDETLVAYVPPEIEEIEEEEPPPPEEEEPPEDLAEEPPQLSLDQLDIALNPGTGGSLAGDFALPVAATSSADLGTEEFVDFSELDRIPRPIGVTGMNFPRRLRQKKVDGRVVVVLKLNEEGEVMEVALGSSNLPEFDDFVVSEVEGWRFTPPTKQGRPVRAKARLPIPIKIR
jgi:protein TonB